MKKRIVACMLALAFLVTTFAVSQALQNPVGGTRDPESAPGATTLTVTGYDSHAAWAAAAGTTTLIDFEAYADGTLITTQLPCIDLVSGTSPHAVPPGPTGVFVTASTSLPFPMFIAGTLPSEPNFLSNDLSGSGGFATGATAFDFAGPTTAVGAFIADGSPIGDFSIEVFSSGSSLGVITVPPRTLPDSFVGIVSTLAFDRAVFFADADGDSWGLDNLEHDCAEATPTQTTTWGMFKALYR